MRDLERPVPRAIRRGLWCALAWALVAPAMILAAAAAEPRDPGLNELVIRDPGVHEQGLPAVEIGADGKVDIPPTLHVHRYYYSEDKEYQGPMITGGPTTVVAQHPSTGERLYIDVVLPPGAPTIAYDRHSITYVYPHKRVVICFGTLFSDKVTVKHLAGHGIARTFREKSNKLGEKIHEKSQQSKLVNSLKDAVRVRKDIVVGAVGVVETSAGFVVDKTNQAIDLIPGSQLLQSIGQQAQERGEIEQVRQAGLEQAREAEKFIVTNR